MRSQFPSNYYSQLPILLQPSKTALSKTQWLKPLEAETKLMSCLIYRSVGIDNPTAIIDMQTCEIELYEKIFLGLVTNEQDANLLLNHNPTQFLLVFSKLAPIIYNPIVALTALAFHENFPDQPEQADLATTLVAKKVGQTLECNFVIEPIFNKPISDVHATNIKLANQKCKNYIINHVKQQGKESIQFAQACMNSPETVRQAQLKEKNVIVRQELPNRFVDKYGNKI